MARGYPATAIDDEEEAPKYPSISNDPTSTLLPTYPTISNDPTSTELSLYPTITSEPVATAAQLPRQKPPKLKPISFTPKDKAEVFEPRDKTEAFEPKDKVEAFEPKDKQEPGFEPKDKPEAQPQLTKEGFEKPPEQPQPQAQPLNQEQAEQDRQTQIQIKQQQLDALVAGGASDEQIQAAVQALKVTQNQPLPAPGGKPSAEQLANLPYTPQPLALGTLAPPGGQPTAQQLANLPSVTGASMAGAWSPQQMAEEQARVLQQAEQQTLDITRRARPNLEQQAYGASAAAAAGAPIFTAPSQEQIQTEKAVQAKAAEDASHAPPPAVTARTTTTAPTDLRMTLGGEYPAEGAVKINEPTFAYSFQDRVQSLMDTGKSAEELMQDSARQPSDLQPVYEAAIKARLRWNIEHPEAAAAHAAISGTGAVLQAGAGILVGGTLGVLQQVLPAIGTVAHADRVFKIAQKIDAGVPLTDQEKVDWRQMYGAFQQGLEGGKQFGSDVINQMAAINNLVTGAKGHPDQMTWAQVGHLGDDDQNSTITNKINNLRQRLKEEGLMATGHLKPGYEEAYRAQTHDLETLEDLQKRGVNINPEVMQFESMAFDPRTWALSLAGPLGVDGLVTRLYARGLEGGAEAMRLGSAAAKAIEPIYPVLGEKAGRAAAAGAVKATVAPILHHLAWFVPAPEALKKLGGVAGRAVGQVPRLIREKWWDPLPGMIEDGALGLRTNTNPLLANYGPAGALFKPVIAAGKGALYGLPYAINPNLTPYERGKIIGTGAGLAALHAAPEAARDAAMSNLFFRDPNNYQTINAPKIDYGSTYGGRNFDAEHNAYWNSLSPLEQQKSNDDRAIIPKVEQYTFDNADYGDAITHLQNQGLLPAGNLKSRGLNILTDPVTGKAAIFINGDHAGFETGPHEIGHSIYRSMTPQEQQIFKDSAMRSNNVDGISQHYFSNIAGRPVRYMNLPSEAGIANGSEQFLPGLHGYTKEAMIEEMGAETVSALLRGQPLHSFTRDPGLFRRLQFGAGRIMNKMGIDLTPEEARTVLGFKPSITDMWLMDKALRDYFKRNPANIPTGPTGGGGGGPGPKPTPKGRKTAATPQPQPQPAPGPQPSPPPKGPVAPQIGPKVQNNQPDIGGGPTGAPQSAIDDAVKGLRSMGFKKREAEAMVASASGETTEQLIRSALKNSQEAKGGKVVEPRPQAPTPAPHPLEPYRKLTTAQLTKAAVDGDQQAVQALIERHGVNWLPEAKKVAPAEEFLYRHRYPEQAAEQDQRLKAAEAPAPAPEPKPAWIGEQDPEKIRQQAIANAEARMDAIRQRAGFMPMAGEMARTFPEEEAGRRTFISPLHGFKQFEIDDRNMSWVAAPKGAISKTMLEHNRWYSPDGTSRLGDIINHPDLFKNYPDLQNIRVEMRPEMRATGAYQAKVPNEPYEKIMLKTEDKGTLAHEIQHAVQYRENWPPGSSPQRMIRELNDDPGVTQDLSAVFNAHYPELQPQDFATQQAYFDHIIDRGERWDQWYKDRLSRMANSTYLAVPGEVEARAVAERQKMPAGWRVKPEESLALKAEEAKQRLQQTMAEVAAPPPGGPARFMPELREGADPAEFIEARNKSKRAGYLSPLVPEDLSNHRLFMNPEKTVGYALSPEGDVQNVFNNGGGKGAGSDAVAHAIANGGRTLDCYDPHLPKLYRQFGFEETGRMTFNPDFAPPAWDMAKDDSPDVVFMGWKGTPEGGMLEAVRRAKGDQSQWIKNERAETREDDWDAAKERSRAAVRGVVGEGRGQAPYPGAEGVPGTRGGLQPEALRPEALEPAEAPSGRAGGEPGTALTEREGPGPSEPQIPGSKVSYMPEITEPAPKGKKAKKPPMVKTPPDYFRRELTPEESALLKDMQARAQAGIAQYPELPIDQAISYTTGKLQFPKKMTKAELGAFFDALNTQKLDFKNPEHQQVIANALTHDVLQRLISDPQSYAWYNRTIDAAMQELGELDPRILNDSVRNLIMRCAMAITSQNQKVHPNFESAYRAYLYWDNKGEMPTDTAYFGGGTKSDAMIANFKKMNQLIEDQGHDGFEEILKKPMSVRQIKEDYDVKVYGEAQDYTSEGSIIFGPKIGSFFNNLSKLYHTLTADLWFTRNMNRLAGRMMGFKKKALTGLEEVEAEGADDDADFTEPESGKHQLGKLRELINQRQLPNATKTQQRTMLKEIDAIEPYRTNPDDLDRETAMALTPTIRDWAGKQHDVYMKSTGISAKTGKPLGTYGDKAPANLVAKNIDLNFTNLQDYPRNSSERKAFRDIMEQVQRNMAGLGIDITHADNQAILWYLEQDLFARAKGRKAGDFSADYLDAAYALRQKYAGQTPDEFGKVAEAELPPEEPKPPREGKAKKAAAMPEGPPFPKLPQRMPVGPAFVGPAYTSAGIQTKRKEEEPPYAVRQPTPRAEPIVERAMPTEVPHGEERPAQPQQPSEPAITGGQNPDGSELPPRMLAVGGQEPAAFITHHTGDHHTVQQTIDVLRNRGLGVEYVMDRQGNIYQIGEAGASHIKPGWGAGAGLNNRNTIGMEVTANDDGDVTPAQKQAFARFMAARYPNTPIFGHGEVNPGHKEEDEGRSTKQAALAYREQRGGGAPQVAGDQDAKRRMAERSIAQVMDSEGSSAVQDGRREIFGFREGQDSEYPELARLRASGDEQGVKDLVAKGLVQRAVNTGSGQINDPAIKAQIISLAHMRGESGARAILNAVGTGQLVQNGKAGALDPEAIKAINSMPRSEVLRRIHIARTIYDQKVLPDRWNRFGPGLASRYAREHEFYGALE